MASATQTAPISKPASQPAPPAPAAGPRASLQAEDGRLFALDAAVVVLGRSKYADVRISERAVSQQHAKIVETPAGHHIIDLGSTNGTFINGVQVRGAELRPGDEIRVGETTLRYAVVGAPLAVSVPHVPVPYVPPPRPPVVHVPETETDAIGLLIKALDFARRYWLQTSLLTVLGLGAGAASYVWAKPPAVATFEVELIQPPADNTMSRTRRMNFEFFRSAQRSFVRPAVIRASLEALGEEEVETSRLRAVHGNLSIRRANRKDAADVYEGSYRAGTAEAAVEYLRVHLAVFLQVEMHKALAVLESEVQTLEAQLASADESLGATEQAVMAFRQEHGENTPDQALSIYAEMHELRRTKGELQGLVNEARETVGVKRKSVNSTAPLMERQLDRAKPFDEAIVDVERELAELVASGKGPQHPRVLALGREKKALQKRRAAILEPGGGSISRERNPAYDERRLAKAEADARLRVAQSDLRRVSSALEAAERRVAAMPRAQRDYAELTRSYEDTQALRKQLAGSLESSRIQLELERASAAARYDVTVPPHVEPVSNAKLLATRMGLLGALGLVLGVMLGLARDLRRMVAARMTRYSQ